MADRDQLPAKLRAKQWLGRAVDSFGGRRRDGVRCLNYHSIVETDQREPAQMTTPVALLRRHLRHLADNGFHVERASAVVDQLRRGVSIDPKTVVLTFDDGFANNYDLAFPVLCEFGVPATFFLVTAALNGEVGKLHNPWPENYFDWSQALEMQTSGRIEFGCHTATHRTLRGLPPETLREETSGAKRELEDRLGRAVTLFAYPFGSYGSWDRETIAAVEGAGFHGAFTTVCGLNTTSTDRFLLKRTRVSWTDEGDEFERVLRGGYDWYQHVQRLQGWLPT